LDGITSTTAELNILDGVTSTAAELNILDGVTSTAAELNILDGVTSTAAELNKLDGITTTAAELEFVNGVTSAIQDQIANAGWKLLDTQEPTSDEATLITTGLSGYSIIKVIVLFEGRDDEDSVSVQGSPDGASWRSILKVDAGGVTSKSYTFEAIIYNFNHATYPKIATNSGMSTEFTGSLDRSNNTESAQDSGGGYSTYQEVWDRVQVVFNGSTFEGSTADKRTFYQVYGQV